jgi:hypothetical protein
VSENVERHDSERPAPDPPASTSQVPDVRLEGPLDLRSMRIPPWVVRRTVTIAVGGALPGDDPAWRDEIVSVAAGTIDIVGRCGRVVRLEAGAVLYLDGVPHVEVRCAGDVPAVLVALQRRPPRPG